MHPSQKTWRGSAELVAAIADELAGCAELVTHATKSQGRVTVAMRRASVATRPPRTSKKQLKLIDRLLACPVKNWFVPLASESTRSLTPWTSRGPRSSTA